MAEIFNFIRRKKKKKEEKTNYRSFQIFDLEMIKVYIFFRISKPFSPAQTRSLRNLDITLRELRRAGPRVFREQHFGGLEPEP